MHIQNKFRHLHNAMQNANKLKEKTQNSFIMEHRNYDQAADEYISGLLQVRNQIPEEVKFDIVSAYSFAVQNESVLQPGFFGDFGMALRSMARGFRVTREAWNYTGRILWYKEPAMVSASICHDPLLRQACESNGGYVQAHGTICTLCSNKELLTGWVPTPVDMFANDWYLVSDESLY